MPHCDIFIICTQKTMHDAKDSCARWVFYRSFVSAIFLLWALIYEHSWALSGTAHERSLASNELAHERSKQKNGANEWAIKNAPLMSVFGPLMSGTALYVHFYILRDVTSWYDTFAIKRSKVTNKVTDKTTCARAPSTYGSCHQWIEKTVLYLRHWKHLELMCA